MSLHSNINCINENLNRCIIFVSTVPVIAGINRQSGTSWVQLPLVVTWALCQGHTAAVEQVEAQGAVAAVVTGGGTLHLCGGHVQTHPWTRTALSLALCCCHVHHALRTHT